MQLHRPHILSRLEKADARYLVASFAVMERLRDWVPYFRETLLDPAIGSDAGAGDPFRRTTFLCDSSLEAYRAYGLQRHSLLTVWRPAIVWQYLHWAWQGKPIRRSPEDKLRQGGDFVVDASGRLLLAHVGRDPSDRPSAETLMRALTGHEAPAASQY